MLSILQQQLQKTRRLQRLLLILGGVCISSISIWVVVTPPAQEFEFIYQAYPDVFWVLFSTGLIASIGILLLSCINGSNYWKIALVFICTLYILFNFLPLFRGWALYGRNEADMLRHIGTTKELLETGHVSSTNFYPVIHVLLAELRFLGFPFRTMSPVLSAIFTSLYIVGMVLFAKELTKNKQIGIATGVCSVPLLYGKFQHTAHPSILSFMTLPIFLFLFLRYYRRSSIQYLIFALLVMLSLVLFHPVTGAYGILAIGIFIVTKYTYKHIIGSESSFYSSSPSSDIALFGLMSLTWVSWYTQFAWINTSIITALGIIQTNQSSVASSYGTQRLAVAPNIIHIITGFIDSYGPIFLMCGFAAVACLFIIVRIYRDTSTFPEVLLTSQFLLGVGISLFTITTYVVAYNPIRNSRYMILMSTLLAGVLFYWLLSGEILTSQRLQKGAVLLVVVLLLASVPISITNTYLAWRHMTYSEKEGTNWVYHYQSPDGVTLSHHVSEKASFYYTGNISDDFSDFSNNSTVPKFFGYRDHDSVKDAVNTTPVYIITKDYDLKHHESIDEFLRSEYIVYTEEDMGKISSDASVTKIYTNDGYTVWYIGNITQGNG